MRGSAKGAVAAAYARRNPDPEKITERNEHLAKQSDWSGTCQFCKKTLTGTQEELVAHRCDEYGESLESSG